MSDVAGDDDSFVDAADVNDLGMTVLVFPSPLVAAVASLDVYLYANVVMFVCIES